MLASAPAYAQVPINLNTWSKQGPAANGNWTVAADGNSVFQSINGNPTFFVSPADFIGGTVDGSFRVETSGDDDYIGFVFGYQTPLASNSDNLQDWEFFLFDWKKNNQAGGLEGFRLVKVDCGPSPACNLDQFFYNTGGSTPEFNVLATDQSTTRGWVSNITYNFTLLYTPTQIVISIDGGTFDNEEIFNLTSADAGVGTFPSGRFGFYNYSQAQVRYAGFTLADADGDGVADNDDNCPATPNPNQEDADSDGVGDACDNCPTLANADQADTNANGVGDACEVADNCADPSTAPSYAGGYVLNAAGTRAFVVVQAPEGATEARFYNTTNLTVGAPETDAESMTAIAGVTRSGDVFSFTTDPTALYFPITTAGGGTRIAFFLEVTDTCQRNVDVDPVFAVTGVSGDDLTGFALADAAPSPTTGAATIRFSLDVAGEATLAVYDVLGRQVARLVDGTMSAGTHEAAFDGSSLPAGVYVYRLTAGGQARTRTLTVAR